MKTMDVNWGMMGYGGIGGIGGMVGWWDSGNGDGDG